MIVGLKTDFKDWYDHMFRMNEGDVFLERFQEGGMNRREILQYLESLGYQVPTHGLVKDIVPTILETTKRTMGMVEDEVIDLSTDIEAAKNAPKKEIDLAAKAVRDQMYERETMFVVYTDETKHRGEGKILVQGSEALAKYPDSYCSKYVQSTMMGGSFSRRILSVGDIGFILEYQSKDDWRSNCGDVQVAVTHRFQAPRDKKIPYPMWAIDFIGQTTVAVDFNTAPGLDAVKDFITATEVYDAVQKFIETQGS